MITIGLTGGIGSGKTTVANMFEKLGVPVYNSDERAKELMTTSKELISAIKVLLGEKAYEKDALNKEYIAQRVFSNKDLLSRLNEIVHPAVREDFKSWAKAQDTAYVIQEAAVLFENGAYEHFDQMILVTAPKRIRLERILHRDKDSEENILARMNHQWEDERKLPLTHYVIENIELSKTKSEVAKIHQKLTVLSANAGF
ncbi:MAG: dephospho-CoA kinase [Flavobacteriaceae bacterium]